MQTICTSLQTDDHTNTSIFTGRMLFLTPNQQCQSTEDTLVIPGVTTKSRLYAWVGIRKFVWICEKPIFYVSPEFVKCAASKVVVWPLFCLQYKILLYYTREKPIAFAKITPSFSFVVSIQEHRHANNCIFSPELVILCWKFKIAGFLHH